MQALNETESFEKKFLFNLQPACSNIGEFIKWYKDNSASIDEKIYQDGGILFKSIGISEVRDFEYFTKSISSNFRGWVEGNYPRKRLSNHVYISTEYDADYSITLHNELSFSNNWPDRLILGCLIPAADGGETPIADSREVLNVLNKDLIDEFEKKGVLYYRNMHGGKGFGISWMDSFQTESQKEVEKYCEKADIEYLWKDDGGLRLTQRRPAVRLHPITKQKVWFNQADQYHPVQLGKEEYETLLMLADGVKEDLPLYACFGDGTSIEEEAVNQILKGIDRLSLSRRWDQGDIVIIDNMLVCHGRKPYKGERKVVVTMSNN